MFYDRGQRSSKHFTGARISDQQAGTNPPTGSKLPMDVCLPALPFAYCGVKFW